MPCRCKSSSLNLAQVKTEKGQAGAWQVIFVSVSRGKAKTYTYSAVKRKAICMRACSAESRRVTRRAADSSPFQMVAIKVDTDEAYKTAAAKSADYIKKNPDKPVMFLMELTRRFPDVTWRVIWGELGGDQRLFGVCGRDDGAILRADALGACG